MLDPGGTECMMMCLYFRNIYGVCWCVEAKDILKQKIARLENHATTMQQSLHDVPWHYYFCLIKATLPPMFKLLPFGCKEKEKHTEKNI